MWYGDGVPYLHVSPLGVVHVPSDALLRVKPGRQCMFNQVQIYLTTLILHQVTRYYPHTMLPARTCHLSNYAATLHVTFGRIIPVLSVPSLRVADDRSGQALSFGLVWISLDELGHGQDGWSTRRLSLWEQFQRLV